MWTRASAVIPTIRWIACLFALVLLPMPQQVYAEKAHVWAIGDAVDLDSAVAVYTETHCLSKGGLTRDVLYRDMEKKLIAHKVLDYSSGPLTPSFVQRNFYSDEVITVELEQDELEMAVIVAGSQVAEKSRFTVSQASMPLVIDAGFDTFVTQNWGALVGGSSKSFQFPFAARQRLLKLRVKAARCSHGDDTDQCFSLKIDNWLLSRLVSPIELGYDPMLKRLTRFRGLSNIGDANGDGQSVDIRYRYDNLSDAVCEWSEIKGTDRLTDKGPAVSSDRDRP